MLPNPLRALLLHGRRRPLRIAWDETYRLPLAPVETGPAPLETRRADDALFYLMEQGAVTEDSLLTFGPVTYDLLEKVHTKAWLESLHDPAALARVYALEPRDVVVDELLKTLRMAVGGTVAAARLSVKERVPALNLLGGFHHAAPGKGSGFCALNDVAAAVAALRQDGFEGRVAVLDFDFHPPDGTAACFVDDRSVWIGSISGADWGPMPHVDETVLPHRTSDGPYLDALDALLGRMPDAGVVFVLAGGDVVAGDRLGLFALSLQGIRERDRRVAEKLAGLPQVWLPAGGYGPHAWKIVAGTGLVLGLGRTDPIPFDVDPLALRMGRISKKLLPEALGSSFSLTEDDVADLMPGLRSPKRRRFLDFYSAQGLEYALENYRMLEHLRRLGFDNLHIEIDKTGAYDRARLMGRDGSTGNTVTLIELEAAVERIREVSVLFVNWMSLRNPRAVFSTGRPKLPGQEVPGLGLAREMTLLLGLIAKRLQLDGVAFRPSWFHMAYAARDTSRFIDPGRQGRFEALLRDLAPVPLLEATRAVSEGRVRLNGQPYEWEPEEMVRWNDPERAEADRELVVAERERCRFTVEPRHPAAPTRAH